MRGPPDAELTSAQRQQQQQAAPPVKPRLSSINLRDPDALAEEVERSASSSRTAVLNLGNVWADCRAFGNWGVARYRREKEEYARQVRAEREIEELQHCTFQPVTNR